MASVLSFQRLRLIATSPLTLSRRALSTLPNNPHIYIHDLPNNNTTHLHLLSYLPNEPPLPSLAIGTTTQIPPTPASFRENPTFLKILHAVIADHAVDDPDVRAQAAVFARSGGGGGGGGGVGSGGMFFFSGSQQQRKTKTQTKDHRGGMGGRAGGGGRGGYIHISDQRNLPDFGRVAYPEDILGSLEVDGEGNFVGGKGRYQSEGNMYRVVTNEGFLKLSRFLRERVRERLGELDRLERREEVG